MNPTILYQLPPNSHCQMMSYVLQTAEGRLVVIDGGCRPDGEALLRFLEKLGGPRPTVAASSAAAASSLEDTARAAIP